MRAEMLDSLQNVIFQTITIISIVQIRALMPNGKTNMCVINTPRLDCSVSNSALYGLAELE